MEASYVVTTNGLAGGWMTRYDRLVSDVLCQRDWQLVAQEELPAFVQRVQATIADGTVKPRPSALPEDTVRRAAIHVYCHELYRATGADGTLRQHRAFAELARHAQGVACRYEDNPDVVQACVQSALQIAWEKRDQVRDPGSFLRWLEQVVYYEIKGYWKPQHRQHEVPMSRVVPAGEHEENDELVQRFWETLAYVPPPDDQVATRQVREQLWTEVRRVLADNQRYQAVIVGYYLYELSLPALAEMLQRPVRNIYVLKSRALDRLRADEEFVRRFADALETVSGGRT